MDCDLCRAEHITEWIYEDKICWVAYCSFHRDTPMVVLRRHSPQPTEAEMEHIRKVKEKLFPDRRFRGYMKNNKVHWHDHLIK